jgi:hypothetical protein
MDEDNEHKGLLKLQLAFSAAGVLVCGVYAVSSLVFHQNLSDAAILGILFSGTFVGVLIPDNAGRHLRTFCKLHGLHL